MGGDIPSSSNMSNLQNLFRKNFSQPVHFDVNVSWPTLEVGTFQKHLPTQGVSPQKDWIDHIQTIFLGRRLWVYLNATQDKTHTSQQTYGFLDSCLNGNEFCLTWTQCHRCLMSRKTLLKTTRRKTITQPVMLLLWVACIRKNPASLYTSRPMSISERSSSPGEGNFWDIFMCNNMNRSTARRAFSWPGFGHDCPVDSIAIRIKISCLVWASHDKRPRTLLNLACASALIGSSDSVCSRNGRRSGNAVEPLEIPYSSKALFKYNPDQQLDDGWPESVEEQGLLLLVWRHHITNNIKMCYRQSRRGVSRQYSTSKYKTIVCIANTFTILHTEAFTRRRFYTQTLLHTEAFTHRRFYTQKLSHTEAFTHRHFHTHTLLHTDACTHRQFYTQKLLHTEAFLHTEDCAHRSFYTDAFYTNAFTHRRFYTQTPLHTETFTHRRFDTQTLWHTTQKLLSRRFYTHAFTQMLFTHRSFHTQHTEALYTKKKCNFTSVFGDRPSFRAKGLQREPWNRNFTAVFDDRTSFRAKGLRRTTCKSHFYLSFWRSNLISCERVARDTLKSQFYRSFWRSNLISCERVARHLEIAILPQFLTIEPHFVRKGCAGRLAKRTFISVFGDRTSFRAKGLRGTPWNRNFTAVFDDRTSFRAKGLRGTGGNRNFTAVFGDRTSFRAKGLRFVPSRWHCPCSRLQKRNRKEGEGKRARGEDVRRCEKMWEDVRRCEKMWEDVRRCEDEKMREDVKMRRCEKMWEDVKMRRWGEDEKMWRWEDEEKMWGSGDVKMRRCEDEKMRRRCEGEKMWRWEDVKMRRCFTDPHY